MDELPYNQAEVCLYIQQTYSDELPYNQAEVCVYVQQTYSDELPYNQAEVCVYIQQTYSDELQYNQPERERFASNERKVPCFKCTLQTGRRGFETLEGSSIDKAQYNSPYRVGLGLGLGLYFDIPTSYTNTCLLYTSPSPRDS